MSESDEKRGTGNRKSGNGAAEERPKGPGGRDGGREGGSRREYADYEPAVIDVGVELLHT